MQWGCGCRDGRVREDGGLSTSVRDINVTQGGGACGTMIRRRRTGGAEVRPRVRFPSDASSSMRGEHVREQEDNDYTDMGRCIA